MSIKPFSACKDKAERLAVCSAIEAVFTNSRIAPADDVDSINRVLSIAKSVVNRFLELPNTRLMRYCFDRADLNVAARCIEELRRIVSIPAPLPNELLPMASKALTLFRRPELISAHDRALIATPIESVCMVLQAMKEDDSGELYCGVPFDDLCDAVEVWDAIYITVRFPKEG